MRQGGNKYFKYRFKIFILSIPFLIRKTNLVMFMHKLKHINHLSKRKR